jgi:hypothetical protein
MPQTAPRPKPRSRKKSQKRLPLPADGEALLRWIDEDEKEHRQPPAEADTGRFFLNRPARKFGRYPGMKNFPGSYWAATTGRHLGHESWNERSWAMVLDFDPVVTGIVSQPFQVIGREGGRLWRHTPDYLAERSGRPRLVIDVRPEDLAAQEDFLRLVDLTRPICEDLGWEYKVVHQVPDQILKNIDFLSAYRRSFPDPLGFRPRLLEAATESLTASDLCSAVGDPIIVKPQFFRLCWKSRIQWDLRQAFRYFATPVVAVTEPDVARRAA